MDIELYATSAITIGSIVAVHFFAYRSGKITGTRLGRIECARESEDAVYRVLGASRCCVVSPTLNIFVELYEQALRDENDEPLRERWREHFKNRGIVPKDDE